MSTIIETDINAVSQGVIEPQRIVKQDRLKLNKPKPQNRNRFLPKTPLGRKLWELRQKLVASGTPLLDWEALAQEIAERKGERACFKPFGQVGGIT